MYIVLHCFIVNFIGERFEYHDGRGGVYESLVAAIQSLFKSNVVVPKRSRSASRYGHYYIVLCLLFGIAPRHAMNNGDQSRFT